MNRLTRFAVLWLVALCAVHESLRAAEQTTVPIELTLVDDQAIAFATFQSHNQKVVSSTAGIFITYVHKSNHNYTAQLWRLAYSADGGKSFRTIYAATHATSAPALEIDPLGTLYLSHPDFRDGNAYLLRFTNPSSGMPTSTTELAGGSAGKYCLLLDERRQQLYWFAHNNTFFVVGKDGTVRNKATLLQAGPHAYLQYPHLTLDAAGTLFAAWTTSKFDPSAEVSTYHDIHAMKSPDGGSTWQSLSGQPIAVPAVADDTGPTTLISRADEFDVHTWLSSLIAKDGKLHFVYWANTNPQRQRYLRYDIVTGRRELDVEPLFASQQAPIPNDSGGFVSDRAAPGSRLYFVSTVDDRSRLACLASDDNGQSWFTFARSDRQFPGRVYSISTARQPTADGALIGTFTVIIGDPKIYYEDNTGHVYFFRIPTVAFVPEIGRSRGNESQP